MSIKKQLAAEAAIEMIEDGMIVGLGTGSTSSIAIDLIGKKVSEGLNILGIPTSKASENQATSLGIPLTSLSLIRAASGLKASDRVFPAT